MKKTLSILLILLLLCSTLSACSQKSGAPATMDFSMSQSESMSNEITNVESITGDTVFLNSKSATHGLKIVYRATLQIETLDYNKSYASIQEAIVSYGGYVSDEYARGGQAYSNSSYNPKSVDITIRIPVEKYQEFLNEGENFGNVLSTSTSSEDITTQYIDTEARLTSLKAQEERLLEMLKSATNIEELIALEDQLSTTRYEIESFTSMLEAYENLVSYTTVAINLEEVNTISVSTDTFGNRILGALKGSLSAALAFLQWLVVFVIYSIPYLVVGAVIFVIVLKIRKNRKNKTIDKPTDQNKV